MSEEQKVLYLCGESLNSSHLQLRSSSPPLLFSPTILHANQDYPVRTSNNQAQLTGPYEVPCKGDFKLVTFLVSKKLWACKHSGIILPTNGSTLLQTTKQSHNKHHQGSFTGDNETKKSSWPHFTYSVRKFMHCVCHHGEEREIHI